MKISLNKTISWSLVKMWIGGSWHADRLWDREVPVLFVPCVCVSTLNTAKVCVSVPTLESQRLATTSAPREWWEQRVGPQPAESTWSLSHTHTQSLYKQPMPTFAAVARQRWQQSKSPWRAAGEINKWFFPPSWSGHRKRQKEKEWECV